MVARVVAWGRARQDVRAIVLFGSLAQPHARVDDLSDVDIEITFEAVTPELLTGSWWREFGTVWTAYSMDPLPMWALVYEGGLTVDLVVVDDSRMAEMTRRLSPNWELGYRVLLDRDGITRRLPAPGGQPLGRGRLTDTEFRRLVDGFWYDGLRVPKYIARGQLWMAKNRDWAAKAHLLRLLEWHSIVLGGFRVDGFGRGRHMPTWLAPELWEAVHGVFGRFDADDAWRALESSVELFWRVAGEVSAASGFSFPTEEDKHLREWMEHLLRRAAAVSAGAVDR